MQDGGNALPMKPFHVYAGLGCVHVRRLITDASSYMDDIQLDNLQAMDALVSFLLYTLCHFTPSSEVSQRLRAVLRQLIEQISTDNSDCISPTLQQNALILCSSISWPYESPLVGSLPAHLDRFVANQPSSEENICG
jgi:hypothetical protein